MIVRPIHWVNSKLGRIFPELRIFLRSETDTRFVRLTPLTQTVGLTGCGLFIGWVVVASAVLLTDMIGIGSSLDQSAEEQRLNAEPTLQSDEVLQAQERFSAAQLALSANHAALLESEGRRRELEAGIEALQATLHRTINERNALRQGVVATQTATNGADASGDVPALGSESLEFLTSALHRAADDRDALHREAAEARQLVDSTKHDLLVLEQRTNRLFGQIEDAITLSIEPLDGAFTSVGLSSKTIIDKIRQGYSGRGGPLTPYSFSSTDPMMDPDTLRAGNILERLDDLILYRLAMAKVPLSMPVKGSFRYTSGFGPRWGRMHYGLDLAARYGKPINATADGVVIFAGWLGNYGRLVKIRHDYGIETRYAHLAKIRVKVGQKVSRGDRIGDMGTSGRSTGTHLHYEIRVSGKPINPMIYIRASQNVF